MVFASNHKEIICGTRDGKNSAKLPQLSGLRNMSLVATERVRKVR